MATGESEPKVDMGSKLDCRRLRSGNEKSQFEVRLWEERLFKLRLCKVDSHCNIALDPQINKELKYKLNEYFKLNIGKSEDKNEEGHLRDDTYIDTLNISIKCFSKII